MRDIPSDDALETSTHPDAVLEIDETGFLKQCHATCGGARQYTGSAGMITNSQIGAFAAYVSRHGYPFHRAVAGSAGAVFLGSGGQRLWDRRKAWVQILG